MKPILLCLLSLLSIKSFAANITGIITDEKGAPLGFASILVKGTGKGAAANRDGKYSLALSPGNYTIICQHIGYKSAEKTITVNGENLALNFTLAEQDLKMEEVVIKRGDDPAIEIMRRTIAKREFYNKQVDSLTVDVYIKGLIRSRAVPDKVLGQKVDKKEMQKQGFDSAGKGILFLSESVTKVSFKRPDKLKLEVISSRESGGGLGISIPFFINFYTNNVALFQGNINPRGFISPVADAAFRYYKFHFDGSFFEDGKLIDRIRVTPRRKNEPLFDGYLQIVDEEWRIHSLNLAVTASQGLDLLDTIRVTQLLTQVAPDVYKTGNQVVTFAAKFFGFDVVGDFLNVYSNYNIDPSFNKKFFNRTFMKFDSAALKRDSSYWSNTRPVPLENFERRDFQLKDSLNKAERDSASSRRYIDSLRKARKPVQLKEVILSGVRRQTVTYKGINTYTFQSLLRGAEYNTVEGLSLSAMQGLEISPRNGKTTTDLGLNTRYGFSNGHLNALATLRLRPKESSYHNRYLLFSGGKQLLQFNHENPIDPLTNTITTLFYKRNYAKYYEAWMGSAEYNNNFESGFRVNISARYEDRIPVENSADYAFFYKSRAILPNHPYELAAVPFDRHAAFTSSITLAYQPGQHYIELPNSKIPFGSRYPTFEIQYTKGFPTIFNSTADFDKWKFSVYDNLNLKLLGTFKYRISAGGFLNNKHVDIPDFTHFNGNQLASAGDYLNTFQLAPYYRYSNTEKLYTVLHAEHHFNGLLTNKIPVLNKLKWNLVAGTNTFYVNGNNYYVEAFAGLENIFKLFRVDFVTAAQAAPGHSFGVRIGFGGALGGSISRRR